MEDSRTLSHLGNAKIALESDLAGCFIGSDIKVLPNLLNLHLSNQTFPLEHP
jgi:hypothetical protein